MILNSDPTFLPGLFSPVNNNKLDRAQLSEVSTMELYKETEGRLFTASVPNLDLSTILFVVIVEAAFLAGNYQLLL